ADPDVRGALRAGDAALLDRVRLGEPGGAQRLLALARPLAGDVEAVVEDDLGERAEVLLQHGVDRHAARAPLHAPPHRRGAPLIRRVRLRRGRTDRGGRSAAADYTGHGRSPGPPPCSGPARSALGAPVAPETRRLSAGAGNAFSGGWSRRRAGG